MVFSHTDTSNISSSQFDSWKIEIHQTLEQLAVIAKERNAKLNIRDPNSKRLDDVSTTISLAQVLRDKAHALNADFRLAVVGHFSRGKSTLINALLGCQLLMSDQRPNTATTTTIRYGTPERMRVTFREHIEQEPIEYTATSTVDLINALKRFTSDATTNAGQYMQDETTNPLNDNTTTDDRYIALMQGQAKSLADSIEHVEVWCDNQFLATFKCEIIDTPGLGGVFKEHRRSTLHIIPTVDATLFLVQIDPAIGSSEVAFIEHIREQVDKFFFVINKIDSIEEEAVVEVMDFVRMVIEEKAAIKIEHLFGVSALNELNGQSHTSGFQTFLPALRQFLIVNKGLDRTRNILRFANVHSKRLLEEVIRDIHHQKQSLDGLYTERQNLRTVAQTIQERKQLLLQIVQERTDEIIAQALHGIESLPQQLQVAVETRINALTLAELQEADVFIEPIMKNVAVAWLSGNQARFKHEMARLNDRVKREIITMLGTIQSKGEQEALELDFDVHLTTPITVGHTVTVSVGEDIVRTLAENGITGIVVDVIGEMIDLGAEAVNIAHIMLNRIRGRKIPPTIQFERLQQARKKVCDLFAKDYSNGLNAYKIVVEGDDHQIKGLRNEVEQSFCDWGISLKRQIVDLVNSNINIRLDQIEHHIHEMQTKNDEEIIHHQIQIYQHQYTVLKNINIQIANLSSTLKGPLAIPLPK